MNFYESVNQGFEKKYGVVTKKATSPKKALTEAKKKEAKTEGPKRKSLAVETVLLKNKNDIWTALASGWKGAQKKVLDLLEDESLKDNSDIGKIKEIFKNIKNENHFLSTLTAYMTGISNSQKNEAVKPKRAVKDSGKLRESKVVESLNEAKREEEDLWDKIYGELTMDGKQKINPKTKTPYFNKGAGYDYVDQISVDNDGNIIIRAKEERDLKAAIDIADAHAKDGVNYNISTNRHDKKYPYWMTIEIPQDNLHESCTSLTERAWKKEVPADLARAFRTALNKEDYTVREIVEPIQQILSWIGSNFTEDDYGQDVEDIRDEITMFNLDASGEDPWSEDDDDWDSETNEDMLNDNVIGPLYDLCDSLSVWIPTDGMLEAYERGALGKDVEQYQTWVDYDMKKYGRISNETKKKLNAAGLQVIKSDKTGDYEVAAKSVNEAKLPKDDQKGNLGDAMDKFQKWVDYDMKRYGKISDKTNAELEKAGLEVIKDDHGDYEVIAKDKKALGESVDEDEITIKRLQRYANENPNMKETVLEIARMIKNYGDQKGALQESRRLKERYYYIDNNLSEKKAFWKSLKDAGATEKQLISAQKGELVTVDGAKYHILDKALPGTEFRESKKKQAENK